MITRVRARFIDLQSEWRGKTSVVFSNELYHARNFFQTLFSVLRKRHNRDEKWFCAFLPFSTREQKFQSGITQADGIEHDLAPKISLDAIWKIFNRSVVAFEQHISGSRMQCRCLRNESNPFQFRPTHCVEPITLSVKSLHA